MKPKPKPDDETMNPATAMQAMLLSHARHLENCFPGANVTLIVSAIDCRNQPRPEFSHVSTAERHDLIPVLQRLAAELKQERHNHTEAEPYREPLNASGYKTGEPI